MIDFFLNKSNTSQHSRLYIKGNDPNSKDIESIKKVILKEYSKYPELIKLSGLQAINLVSNLQVINNSEINTYVNNTCSPDPEANWIYFDVDIYSKEKLDYFTSCIHHEFWHFLEFKFTNSFNPTDPEWQELNTKDFDYGQGGWYAYHNDFDNTFAPEGFITNYSTLGMDEDKAEMFMYMFSDHLKPILLKRIKDDTILKNKYNLMRERVEWLENNYKLSK